MTRLGSTSPKPNHRRHLWLTWNNSASSWSSSKLVKAAGTYHHSPPRPMPNPSRQAGCSLLRMRRMNGPPSVSRRAPCGSIDNYLPQRNRDLVSSRSSDHNMQAETQTENACPSCKAPNAAGARFCSGCGSALSAGASAASQAASPHARKVCAGCNKINDASAQFCLHCGTRLPAAASVPAFGEPAGFWIRALALILDGVILAAVGWLVEERLGLPHDVPGNLEAAEKLLECCRGCFSILPSVPCT